MLMHRKIQSDIDKNVARPYVPGDIFRLNSV